MPLVFFVIGIFFTLAAQGAIAVWLLNKPLKDELEEKNRTIEKRNTEITRDMDPHVLRDNFCKMQLGENVC